MEQVRKYIEQTAKLTDREWIIFSSKLVKQEFPKKTILLEKGEIENYLSFIKEGIVRFFIPKEGNDVTFDFAFKDNFFSAYDSFLTQNPSTYQIETLTDTVIWRLSYQALQGIYQQTKTGNMVGRFAAEELYLKKSAREKSLLNQSAEERYLRLFKKHSNFLKFIPLKYIASYIGITPQALGRIRQRIS